MRSQDRLETVAGNGELHSAMSGSTQNPSASGAGIVSITLIGPDEPRRKEVATALSEFPGVQLTEFSAYPIDPAKPSKGYGENTLWIITEADRSVTTFLLPSEY